MQAKKTSSAELLERLQSRSRFNPSMSFTASPMATNMSLFSWDNRCLASSEHWSSPSAGHRAVPEAELHGHVYWQLLRGRHKVL